MPPASNACRLAACLFLQVSGTKFYYLRNEAALLELALVNYTMQKVGGLWWVWNWVRSPAPAGCVSRRRYQLPTSCKAPPAPSAPGAICGRRDVPDDSSCRWWLRASRP